MSSRDVVVATNSNCNFVAKGLQLLLDDGNPFESYSHFNSAIEATQSEEERRKIVQFRDAAAATLVRMELESGDNYAKLGRFGSALEAYTSIRDVSSVPPMIHFQMLNNAGVCLARLGRKEESLAMQLKAFALNPRSTKTLKNIAILLADLGKFEEAVSAFDTYLDVHPESYSALCGKAGCLKDLFMYPESIIVAGQAQLVDPKLLRGRCAYDLKEHCRIELSKLRIGRNDASSVDANKLSLASYFTNMSTASGSVDFRFEEWLKSVKSNFGDKNVYDDFNLPNNLYSENVTIRSPQDDFPTLSPDIRYREKTSPFSAKIPGNDVVVASTPMKQDALIMNEQSHSASTPFTSDSMRVVESTLVENETVFHDATYMSSFKLDSREFQTSTCSANHPIKSMDTSPSISRIPSSYLRTTSTSTSKSDFNFKTKHRSLDMQEQEQSNAASSSQHNRPGPAGGWLKSPLPTCVLDHKVDHKESSGKLISRHNSTRDVISEQSTTTILSAEHQSLPLAEQSFLISSLSTPTKATVVPRAGANHSNQTMECITQMHHSDVPFVADRRKPAKTPSTYGNTLRFSKLVDNQSCFADQPSNHESSRFPRDTVEKIISTDKCSKKTDDRNTNTIAMKTDLAPSIFINCIEVPSRKPMRRSKSSREVSVVSKRMECVSDQVLEYSENGGSKWISPSDAISITSNRRDRDRCVTPSSSLDLPSPNMGATDVKPTLMIPYQKLRLLNSSVESNISSIDTCRKENNLYQEEFEQVFEMTRDQWNALPSWQQARKKKLVGLF